MRKTLSNILALVGVVIICIPFILRGISYFNQTKVVSSYREETKNKSKEELEEEEIQIDEYNSKLVEDKPSIVIDQSIANANVSSFDFLSTGEVIGTLVIPKINVDLPIYEGVSEENLEKGVVHLDDTSYPTGKVNTHTVLAGHSGLTNAKILDDLDELEIGDTFKIEYLNEETTYEVCDIEVVLPEETDSLNIVENECLVTLVTCTPKSINTHRLLVTGKKVEATDNIVQADSKILTFFKQNYMFILLLLLLIIIVIAIKRREKGRDKQDIEKRRGAV